MVAKFPLSLTYKKPSFTFDYKIQEKITVIWRQSLGNHSSVWEPLIYMEGWLQGKTGREGKRQVSMGHLSQSLPWWCPEETHQLPTGSASCRNPEDVCQTGGGRQWGSRELCSCSHSSPPDLFSYYGGQLLQEWRWHYHPYCIRRHASAQPTTVLPTSRWHCRSST